MALNAEHADEKTSNLFRRCFLFGLCDSQGTPLLSYPQDKWPDALYILDKTPRNALNIPFLLEVFPKAKFIYLYRDPRQTVSSLMEAWSVGLRSGRFVTFRDLPHWHLPGWCFLLPPHWQSMRGKTIPEIAAFQWVASNEAIMSDLSSFPANQWVSVFYDDMIADMPLTIRMIFETLGIRRSDMPNSDLHDKDKSGANGLALSRTTLSPPHKDKWKRHEAYIAPLWPQLSDIFEQIKAFGKA